MSALLNRTRKSKAMTLSNPYMNFLVSVVFAAVPQLVVAQPVPLGTSQTQAPVGREHGVGNPNARIGNPGKLGSLARPFADYIATVHRQVHRSWGDGFLAELNHHPSTGRYPLDLVTALEISLKSDGTVNNVHISLGSGFWSFDAAAIEAVLGAAPFPAPPQSIKSADGNVYVTWLFHRDDRQCATDFVSAHILTAQAKPTPAGLPLASPQAAGGEQEGSSAQTSETCSPPVSSAVNAASVPDEARAAAELWLTGYRNADVRGLANSSAVPFTASGRTAAEDQLSLRWFYKEMVAAGQLKRESVRYYTAAQIKKLRGSLPRGGDRDNLAFAWVEHGGEDLILILQPACHGWHVSGVDR